MDSLLGNDSELIDVLDRSITVDKSSTQKSIAYIGAWGEDGMEGGIEVFEIDDDNRLRFIANTSPIVNAGIICISPDKKYLYATDERKDFGGIYGNGGGVCAYKINQTDGTLVFLNEVSSVGAYPCYITIDKNQKFVFISNHGNHVDTVTRSYRSEDGSYKAKRTFDEGSIAMFPILEDGRVGECCDLKILDGNSIVEHYQWTPHPHSVKVDPSNTFLLSGDKGSDRVRVYRIDYQNGRLNEVHNEKAMPGSGPRHIVFHPTLPFVYINSELDSTVHSYRFYPDTGKLDHLVSAKTIPIPYYPPDPTDHFAKNETADIRIHKSGNFLYVSNRGHNSIAIFTLDKDGGIEALERPSSGGQIPRAINFDLSGDILYAVNQRSGNVVQFRVDGKTGLLSLTCYEIQLSSHPVCMEFVLL